MENPKTSKCFVCGNEIPEEVKTYNNKTNMPVCQDCRGTNAEKQAEKEAIDSLGEGFVCGCI
jgi:ribosome-binding protein aMBF1 (putative translation factor)